MRVLHLEPECDRFLPSPSQFLLTNDPTSDTVFVQAKLQGWNTETDIQTASVGHEVSSHKTATYLCHGPV